MEKKNLLFVDDDTHVLSGLRRRLNSHRQEWKRNLFFEGLLEKLFKVLAVWRKNFFGSISE